MLMFQYVQTYPHFYSVHIHTGTKIFVFIYRFRRKSTFTHFKGNFFLSLLFHRKNIHCGSLRKICEFCCLFTNATFLCYFCACFTSKTWWGEFCVHDPVSSDASCQDSAPVAGMLPLKLTIKLSANVWNSTTAEVQHIRDFMVLYLVLELTHPELSNPSFSWEFFHLEDLLPLKPHQITVWVFGGSSFRDSAVRMRLNLLKRSDWLTEAPRLPHSSRSWKSVLNTSSSSSSHWNSGGKCKTKTRKQQ